MGLGWTRQECRGFLSSRMFQDPHLPRLQNGNVGRNGLTGSLTGGLTNGLTQDCRYV